MSKISLKDVGGGKQLDQFDNLVSLYQGSVAAHADRPLFGRKDEDGWKWFNYSQFARLVDRFRRGLAALGLNAGDNLAIISGNSLEWAVSAYSAFSLKAAFVPLYDTQGEADWEFILRDSQAKILLVSTPEILGRVQRFARRIPTLKRLVCLGQLGDGSGFNRLLHCGQDRDCPEKIPRPEDLASIIYTSGTTGQPKGVRLSHGNIASNVNAVRHLFPLSAEDRCLSLLPWAHSFGQTAELHLFLSLGAAIAVCRSPAEFADDLIAVQPTVICAVPRIFGRVYAGISRKMENEPALIRRLMQAGLRLAAKQRSGAKLGWSDRMTLKAADRLIFSKVRQKFGGRLRYAISGGAALSPEAAEFIDSLGIAVYEGYGLSETSPIVSCNSPGSRRLGSVGRVIDGVTVTIDPKAATGAAAGEGEIIVAGPTVMLGYHNQPQETAKVIDGRGFHTGDIGRLDSDGFLFITGRIKEQYKLQNGRYVAPAPLEEALKLSPLIANVMIYGDNRPYNVALVVPDLTALRDMAKAAGLKTWPTDWQTDMMIRSLVQAEVDRRSQGFRKYERISQVALLSEDFSQANGLLTPTLKLKRELVTQRFQEVIDALYR